jgi:spore maturation protein CgeB
LKEAKKYVKKIIGEISSPIAIPKENFKYYDFLFSSLPHFVERFKKMGIQSAYLPYGFDQEILKLVGKKEKKYSTVFVGGLDRNLERVSFLEALAKKVKVEFWGQMNPPLPRSSPILENYHGQAWGIDMFEILAQSKIIVNRHTQTVGKQFINKEYANNVRLYEATGMGSFLITDAKENLKELFEVGKEVETYNSLEELTEKINYYLRNDEEREKIAKAGQERTLKDHTYEVRAKKLLDIIKSISSNI